jgi:uncharacterized membrane protein
MDDRMAEAATRRAPVKKRAGIRSAMRPTRRKSPAGWRERYSRKPRFYGWENCILSSITESIDVDVSVTAAYNQWTQFESFPNFMSGVESIRQIDDTHTHWVVSAAGVRREFDATITEQHPDERIAWRSDDGPQHAGVVTFHRLSDATTRVTAQMDIDPEGFVENVADKLGILDRQVKGDMARFKEFIESRGGTATGGWSGDVERPGQNL